MTLAIVVNTIILGLDHYPIKAEDEEWFAIANYFFLIIFVFELVIRVLALSWKSYLSQAANVFDLIVVSVSILELVISYFNFKMKAL